MAVNILSIKNSLKNLIDKNNTNTSSYNVSASMTSKVAYITGGNSKRQPVLNINYPAIFVELASTVDDHITMGMTARRETEAEFNIVAVTDYGQGTGEDGEEIDNEMIQLTQNIHNLLRNYITLSNTVDSCLITGTNYITDEGYNARSEIQLRIKRRG
jgi:hypothetical protein